MVMKMETMRFHELKRMHKQILQETLQNRIYILIFFICL